MKSVLLALLVTLTLTTPRAYAQSAPLLVVIEPGSARVDPEALRRELVSATAREMALPGEPRASEASAVLSVTYDGARRWTLRFERGELHAVRTTYAGPIAIRASLERAILELLTEVDEAREIDLIDPFEGRWAWDPLAEATRGEVPSPFAPPGQCAYVAIIDPFAPPSAFVDLHDPWAR